MLTKKEILSRVTKSTGIKPEYLDLHKRGAFYSWSGKASTLLDETNTRLKAFVGTSIHDWLSDIEIKLDRWGFNNGQREFDAKTFNAAAESVEWLLEEEERKLHNVIRSVLDDGNYYIVDEEGYSYTIGLSKYGFQDVVIYDIEPHRCMTTIRACVSYWRLRFGIRYGREANVFPNDHINTPDFVLEIIPLRQSKELACALDVGMSFYNSSCNQKWKDAHKGYVQVCRPDSHQRLPATLEYIQGGGRNVSPLEIRR